MKDTFEVGRVFCSQSSAIGELETVLSLTSMKRHAILMSEVWFWHPLICLAMGYFSEND